MSSPADAKETSAEALAAFTTRLAQLGVAADVEADGALAILRPRAQGRLATPSWNAATRVAVVEAARRCGFRNVALELPSSATLASERDDADLRRAEPLA